MTDEFENQLRRAMRPVDAPEGFAERLMKRLPEREKPVLVALPTPPRRSRQYGLPAALAASLLAAVLLGQQLASHRFEREEQAAGLAAKQELLQALRVTSQKLDMAYQAVNSPPAQPEAEVEENRS
jgi:hypothetical protein